jgi:hypothetical protein
MALAFVFPSFGVEAAWKNVQIATGVYACKDDATGVTFKPPYSGKSDVTKACNVLTSFVPWLGTAEATPISKQLNANGDGTRDTAFPCLLADFSDCKTDPAILSWTSACLDTALAPLTNVQVGTPVDASIDSCLTGTGAATATITFVKASDGSSCNTDFSVTGSSPNRKIHDAATGAGSGTCKPKAVYMTTVAQSTNTYAWANITPSGGDTTPPTSVTGITAVPGNLSATVSFDAQMDPADAVVRSGVASYKIYDNLTFNSSLAAASPGLNCDFTPQSIGAAVSGSPSATQGTGFSGAQWTVNARGYGTEAADSYYGVSCPVSGTSVSAISRVDTIPAAATYNKAHAGDIRNSTSTTAAHYDCDILRQVLGGVSTYYLQRTMRLADGDSNGVNSVALSGSPPFYVRGRVVNNVGDCAYSTDGGTWQALFQNDAIVLNDSKIVAFGGSATNTGADDAAISVVFGSVAVQTAGTLSKTVTLTAGAHTLKVSSVDVTGNESAQNGGVTVTVSSGAVATAKKWHPGFYLTAHRNNTCLDSQPCRFTDYDNNQATNLQGYHWIAKWSALESTQGNYTAGIALVRAELAHVKALSHPKRLFLQIMDEPNQSQCGSFTCQANFFPSYVASACIVQSTFTGDSRTFFTWWRPACAQYFANLMTALGAAVDSDTALEAVILNYEEAYGQDVVHGGDFSIGAFNAGVTTVMTAAAAAFPKTNVIWRGNWGIDYTEASVTTLINLAKAHGLGWGDQDACDLNPVNGQYTYGGQMPSYILGDNKFAGYGTVNGVMTAGQAVDQRGKMAAFFGIETSGMGDNAVCGSPGLTGLTLNASYGSYFDWVNLAMQASHAIIDYNDYTGIAEQKWAHAASNKSFYDMVQLSPLTHTACPTDYDTLYGNGSAGSGCDTSN